MLPSWREKLHEMCTTSGWKVVRAALMIALAPGRGMVTVLKCHARSSTALPGSTGSRSPSSR